MQSGRKNGFCLGNKRIILAESGVVSRGLVRPCFDNAKVQHSEKPAVPFGDVPCVLGSLWLTKVFDDEFHLPPGVAMGVGRRLQGTQFLSQFAVVVDPIVEIVHCSLLRLGIGEVEHGQLRLAVGAYLERLHRLPRLVNQL